MKWKEEKSEFEKASRTRRQGRRIIYLEPSLIYYDIWLMTTRRRNLGLDTWRHLGDDIRVMTLVTRRGATRPAGLLRVPQHMNDALDIDLKRLV